MNSELLNELNKGIASAREQSIQPLEAVTSKATMNKLFKEFAELEWYKSVVLDQDYVAYIKANTEVIDGLLGHYRGLPLRLVSHPVWNDGSVYIRERDSLKVLYKVEVEK